MPKKSIAIDLEALGLRFESLGNGCEFGLFQRCCGVEPLGLLRFASARLSSLTDGLANGFLDYGAPEDLLLAYEDGEYMCRSRRYDDFRYHTNVVDEVVDLDRLRARESRRIGFLRERLLSDLAAGEKIMVRTGDDPIDGVMDLAAMLHRAGTPSLLWVTEGDDLHPPGHVELIGPGLIRGRVRKYARYAPVLRIDLDSWRRICIQTLGLIAAGGTRSDHHVVRGQTLCRGHGFELKASSNWRRRR